MSKKSNIIFTNDENSKMLLSEDFNFALDKNTGVSACWGKTINDSPEYDPISPQELVFKIDQIFQLNNYLKQFIFLGNIKEQKSNTEFINNEQLALSMNNLVSLSTLASVVLIFDDSLNKLKLNDVLTFIKFINKFKVSVIIQLNINDKISDSLLTKIKLLGTSIQIKTNDQFNGDNFIYNINLLKEQKFILSAKILINKNNYKEIVSFINEDKLSLISKETAIKLYFNEPFVTAKQYKDIQNKFIEQQFNNARIATCFNNHFNKKNPNMCMLPMDCDAGRYSIYIENNKIYPCEFNQSVMYNIEQLQTIRDFWHDKKLTKFRKYVIDNNFCK